LKKATKNKRENEENTFSQKLRGIISKALAFLGQTYVWLSLTVGFLWMFSAPFVIYFLGDFVEGLTGNPFLFFQLVFFPLASVAWVFQSAAPADVWAIVYSLAYVFSMLFCLGVAYIIHRARSHSDSKQLRRGHS
jgi:hypothetical protein